MNTNKPDLRVFVLDKPPNDYTMNLIYQWAPANSVYAHWINDSQSNRQYRMVFHQWTHIKPELQTALILMLT